MIVFSNGAIVNYSTRFSSFSLNVPVGISTLSGWWVKTRRLGIIVLCEFTNLKTYEDSGRLGKEILII